MAFPNGTCVLHREPRPGRGLPALAAGLCLAACAGPALAEGSGRGLLTWDREPPSGAVTWPRPVLRRGDRFTYVRGNALRVAVHVETSDDGYLLHDEGAGITVERTQDLADRRERARNPDGTPGAVHIELAPPDEAYHWPLWVGKRWTCHHLRKAPGRPPLPLLVSYCVEAAERVTVPAGTFDTLRIARRANVAADGKYIERFTLSWYAPAAGAEVRRLEDGVLTELVEFQRQ
jgi:hypothetical protein